MDRPPSDLSGLSAAQAREYIAAHIAALKLTEKKIAEKEAEKAKWTARAALARQSAAEELAAAADAQTARLDADLAQLAAEAAELAGLISAMKHQLGALPAKERSVDPDYLEQDLLMAAGRLPGDETAVQAERDLAKLEKQSSADAALAALKQKMARKDG